MGQNPWLAPKEAPAAERVDSTPAPSAEDTLKVWTGVATPQPRVPVPDRADCLGQVRVPDGDTLWVVGVHGGAGETTVASWLQGRGTGRRWPAPEHDKPTVLLVARTSSAGMNAARLAAREWASGAVPVTLVGLVLVADAPGALPRQLREEAKHLSGAVPRTWQMPFIPALRVVPAPGQSAAPSAARSVLRSITKHLTRSTP